MAMVLITGASSGIGQATAKRLAADGHDIIVHYNKNSEGAYLTQKMVEENGQKAILFQYDLTNIENIEKDFQSFFKFHNLKVTVLINNAGITKDNLSALMEFSEFDEVMKVNLYAPFFISKAFMRQFPRKETGSIVNISSLSGQIGNLGQSNYSASKAGLISLTKTMSKEVGRKNLRINAIAAGVIETELSANIEKLENIKKQIPMNRFGKVDEIASVVSFLCSEDSTYITGQTISVNGGIFST